MYLIVKINGLPNVLARNDQMAFFYTRTNGFEKSARANQQNAENS